MHGICFKVENNTLFFQTYSIQHNFQGKKMCKSPLWQYICNRGENGKKKKKMQRKCDWGETFCGLFKPTCPLLFIVVQGLKVSRKIKSEFIKQDYFKFMHMCQKFLVLRFEETNSFSPIKKKKKKKIAGQIFFRFQTSFVFSSPIPLIMYKFLK